jgi:hypothetical protein
MKETDQEYQARLNDLLDRVSDAATGQPLFDVVQVMVRVVITALGSMPERDRNETIEYMLREYSDLVRVHSIVVDEPPDTKH